MRRTLVKVCGITRLEDAAAACLAGADWIGFVLSGESPRRIAPEDALVIARASEPAIAVAVLVAPTPEQALALARRAGCARVQLHRVDPAAWPADFPLPASFAVPVHADGRLGAALPEARHLVLLDAAHPTLAGGTGRRLPWQAAMALAARRDVMLAGGLDADSVGEAIAQVHPYGVDASSRLESAPGVKDAALIHAFVRAARDADERIARAG